MTSVVQQQHKQELQTGMEPTEPAPQYIPFNPNPKTLTWERLETLRLKKLGLWSNKYSRHFQVSMRTSRSDASQREAPLELAGSCRASPREAQILSSRLSRKEKPKSGPGVSKKVNSIAPFATVEKPTCGFFFSFGTDNKKMKFGIPPSDLVKWRNFSSSSASN